MSGVLRLIAWVWEGLLNSDTVWCCWCLKGKGFSAFHWEMFRRVMSRLCGVIVEFSCVVLQEVNFNAFHWFFSCTVCWAYVIDQKHYSSQNNILISTIGDFKQIIQKLKKFLFSYTCQFVEISNTVHDLIVMSVEGIVLFLMFMKLWRRRLTPPAFSAYHS